MKWLKQNRTTFLPWVQDWTDPQDHIRNCTNVNKLKYDEWFWCHPSAFRLINVAAPLITCIMFSVGGVLGFIYNSFYVMGISLVFLIIVGQQLAKNLKLSKSMTMYDFHLRDWKDC